VPAVRFADSSRAAADAVVGAGEARLSRPKQHLAMHAVPPRRWAQTPPLQWHLQ